MLAEQLDAGALAARAETLCRRIAPLDLADQPLYIVPQSRLPDHLGGRSVCTGFTAPRLDLYLRPVIGPAWRGRGGCIVVDDSDMATMDPDDAATAFMAVVLHEFAHILDRPAVRQPGQPVDPERIQFEALCLGRAVAAEEPPAAAPFEGHGLRFIRAALHLRCRAEAAGMFVPLHRYCGGTPYGLSHPNRYLRALGDEPGRLAGLAVRRILDSPCPRAFWRLWTGDMAHWLCDRPPYCERSVST